MLARYLVETVRGQVWGVRYEKEEPWKSEDWKWSLYDRQRDDVKWHIVREGRSRQAMRRRAIRQACEIIEALDRVNRAG